MLLWFIFAGLAVASLIAVLYPFLRSSGAVDDATAFDTAVFKDQLEEIAAEQERGVISEAEAEAARTEVSRRLLATAQKQKKKNKEKSLESGGAATVALVCAFLFVPVTSTVLYLIYGSPGLPDQPLAARQATEGNQTVNALVARVEERLRNHPEDGRGWEVLAPVYFRQQRYADAANAYGKAARLLGATPRRMVDYGNALVVANNGVVTEHARDILKKALAADDSLIRAHFWLAVAKEQDGEYADAAKAWRIFLQKVDERSPLRDAVKKRLAAVEEKAGLAGKDERSEKTKAADAGANAGGTTLRGPTQEDVSAAGQMSASDRSAMIKQMVSGLAERLKSDGGSVDEWKRLVRSYVVLGDKPAAEKALSDARTAFASDPKALASLGEMANSLGL